MHVNQCRRPDYYYYLYIVIWYTSRLIERATPSPTFSPFFCSLTIISMATEINTQTSAPNTFEAWLENCSHVFPLLSLQDASHAHHKPRASNRSFMQMCKVFKLTTTASNQAPRRCHWLNIWSIYRALGQVCWAIRIIWHWPKNYGQLTRLCDHMMKNVWWLKNKQQQPQRRIHHPSAALEITWECDESLLRRSLVYIKAMHLASSSNQSGEKSQPPQEDQSKFNINTENTFSCKKSLLSDGASVSEWVTNKKQAHSSSVSSQRQTREEFSVFFFCNRWLPFILLPHGVRTCVSKALTNVTPSPRKHRQGTVQQALHLPSETHRSAARDTVNTHLQELAAPSSCQRKICNIFAYFLVSFQR